MRASGVNPSDVKSRSGRTRRGELSLTIPHSDGAGVIEAVGEGVPAARVGERVWTHNAQYKRPFGTCAQYVSLPAALAARLPDNVAFHEGACLGIPALTAWCAVTAEGPVQGKTVLVAGGAGAVGHYAVQIAKLLGARVFATVSSPEKARHAQAAGAELAINYRTEDVERAVKAVAPQGVDMILELNMSANAKLDAALLRPFGTLVVYGSDEPEAVVPIRQSFGASHTHRYFLVYEVPLERRRRGIDELNGWMEKGLLRHAVAARFPLDEAAAAHEAVESGKVMGNVVVEIP